MSADQDRRRGCRMPPLDPFSEEIMQYHREFSPVYCKGKNWVECYKSECFVRNDILKVMDEVACVYRDMLFENDYEVTKGEPVTKVAGEHYKLLESNHVEVVCTGKKKNGWSVFENLVGRRWRGHATGLRPLPAPGGRPTGARARPAVNIVIMMLDSLSHGGFIREMPKTRQCIGELGAVILNSYNIVGDGTASQLFPILTGRNYQELNGRRGRKKTTIDPRDFIFHDLKELGYRTGFFEDYPVSGTFQMHYNGFEYPPVDDYLRPFTLEERNFYCAGSIPKHRLLMKLTDQFVQLADKHILLYTMSLAHDDEELLSTIDEEFTSFLQELKNNGSLKNTLLFLMGDHGPRFQGRRNTFQGRLEERLPLVAIILPDALKKSRPDALDAVKSNADVLTTPYDIHTTMLDAVGLDERANQYKVPNAHFPRGLSLLKPIPARRGCGAAGVAAHWCACAAWRALAPHEPLHGRAAAHLAAHINRLTAPQRSQCVFRTLTSIEWVLQLDTSEQLLKNSDSIKSAYQFYQAKITMDPLMAEFEGTLAFDVEKQRFSVDSDHISRVNRYNDDPRCILKTHRELHKFCLCKDMLLFKYLMTVNPL